MTTEEELARARARVGRALRRVAIAVVVLFVGAELIARAIDAFAPGEVGTLAQLKVDKGDYWVMRPNTTLTQNERYGDRTYSINRDGFRDRDHALEPAADCRVLFLGDSVTFGLSARAEETFVRRIEHRLNRESPACESYDVMSMALPGYSPRDELAALNDVGLAYEPDLIVLQLYMNDFSAGSKGRSLGRVRTGWHVLEEALFEHVALARRAHQALFGLVYWTTHVPRRTVFPESLNASEPASKLRFFEGTADRDVPGLQHVRKIHALARDAGIPVLQWLSPNEVQLFREEFDLINRRVATFSFRHGYDHHDPLRELRRSSEREHIMADGLHYSGAGHQAVAEWLFPLVEARLKALPSNAPLKQRVDEGRGRTAAQNDKQTEN